MKRFDEILADEVRDIIGKPVAVKIRGEIIHRGVVLGNTISGIQVGLTWSSLGVEKRPGQKFISIFYARRKQLDLCA